jgi:putative hydrolase of the HAD superfamily
MKNNKIKGIIFDYGGTLDSNGTHWAHVIWDAYKKAGIPISEEQFREAYVYGERFLALNPVISPDFNFHDLMEAKIGVEFDFLAEKGILQKNDLFQKQIAEIADNCYNFARKTVSDSRKVIEELHKQYPLILVSNFYGNIETVLEDFGIRTFFGKIIESAVVKVRKPDPAIFGLGVSELGLNPEEVVVIGDSYSKDIIPAKACGCQTIWIKGKGWERKEEVETSAADIILPDFKAFETTILQQYL